MAEATSDDTPQPSSYDTPHELSPENMIRLLRHVMTEWSVTQEAKERDLINATATLTGNGQGPGRDGSAPDPSQGH